MQKVTLKILMEFLFTQMDHIFKAKLKMGNLKVKAVSPTFKIHIPIQGSGRRDYLME